jgi:hypothetical protein
MHLSERHHAMIGRAAALLGPSTRGRFLLHVRARLADEHDLMTVSGLVNVLIRTLGDFGVSVGPAFFRHQQPGRGNHAGAVEEAAQRS